MVLNDKHIQENKSTYIHLNSRHELFIFHANKQGTLKRKYSNIDQCIDHSQSTDLFSLAALLQGQPLPKRQRNQQLKPFIFVNFENRKRKFKPVIVKALLDSGGSETIITSKWVKKLQGKILKKKTEWDISGRNNLITQQVITAEFILSEFMKISILNSQYMLSKI